MTVQYCQTFHFLLTVLSVLRRPSVLSASCYRHFLFLTVSLDSFPSFLDYVIKSTSSCYPEKSIIEALCSELDVTLSGFCFGFLQSLKMYLHRKGS